ncbi:MAG: hypothetical protein ABIQ40_10265 [Bacteroidia bacterium]
MFRILIVLFLLANPLSAKQISFLSDTIPCDATVKVQKTFCPSCEVWNDQFAPDFTGNLPVEYHLSVFDNDSVEVFSSVDIDNGWDGKGKDDFEQTQSFRWEMSYRYEKNGTLYQCSDKLILLQ